MSIPNGTEQRLSAQDRALPWNEILDSAAQGLITARCRHFYVHEMRGGLYPLSMALELLLRASSSTAKDSSVLDQASTLAKRAMSILKESTVDLVNQITFADDAIRTVNLGETLDGVLRLLRTDMDQKGIVFNATTRTDIVVQAESYKLRSMLLGLISLSIDELQPGAEMSVVLTRDGRDARIEVLADIDFPHIDFSETLFTRGDCLTTYALILAAARQWLTSRGGSLEVKRSPQAAIEVQYPLAVGAVAPPSVDDSAPAA
jgi:signal transduction histidine kinase